ncbi:C6 zinc finger domain protein [Aspergillus piperis CBS 112811]|uniref:C6 zinc finger domain protein n=1 Tax=Aspergillus piperis CBS 112811 TaxID=1448313 RepID=A0A8G1QY05_9EURO|nr:C6 zinc finger domain protein [Aspergillus piperis CBS 112811]RAH56486.1 C6 zinc finger domain protein [Aspergillus piperis CBS 112811]
METKRRRKYAPKSRTGCRTCRTRRIKCDEAPGACKNCTSTGRTCDGYDFTRLPTSVGGHLHNASRPKFQLRVCLPGMSSDERRCFTYFQTHTVPRMVGFFDSELWQRLALQLSQAETAVCHAVVALGALHQDSEARGMLVQKVDLDRNDHHRFALEQYNRAISALQKRLQSNDPQARLAVLMCCVTFVFFEYLQGNRAKAFAHLQNGLQVLANRKGNEARTLVMSKVFQPAQESTAERALLRAFAQLDAQSAFFKVSGSVTRLGAQNGYLTTDIFNQEFDFQSLEDVKGKLDPLGNVIFRFRTTCRSLLCNPMADVLQLTVEHHKLRTQLMKHISAFEAFRARIHPSNMTTKEARSLDTIRLHHIVLMVDLETVLSLSELVYDYYLPQFRTFVDLCERIINSMRAEYGQDLTKIVADIGIIAPLGWTSLRCRDLPTRQRALSLLDSWPHCEGPYDSRFFATLARQVVAIESEGEVAGFIPEYARVRDTSLEMLGDGHHAVLCYTLSDPEKMDLQVHRRPFLFR